MIIDLFGKKTTASTDFFSTNKIEFDEAHSKGAAVKLSCEIVERAEQGQYRDKDSTETMKLADD